MSEEAMNRNPNDPNKGMNVTHFMAAVLIGLVAILVCALIIVRANKNKVIPHATMPRATSAASPQ